LSAITPTGAYVGTDRLGRALTDAENRQLGKLLRDHDFPGASLVALRFASRLVRSREAARDLLGRTNLRLVRWGWDPAEVPLVKRLCRLVWSEHTHQLRETDAAKRAEQAFLREQEVTEGRAQASTPSREERVVRLEQEREDDARDARELERLRGKLDELRAHLRAEKDEVNLLYLDYVAREITDPARMARDSTRDVTEFYAAAKRRKRVVLKLLAAKSGVPENEEKD
jgi:hypothetical protein